MKKVLFVATVDEHIRHFHLPFIEWFVRHGYEVHVAANGNETFPNCSKKFDISYQRTPFSLDNFRANHDLRRITNENNYELIHFHTPVASVFGRWATRIARRHGTKVLYTAHGFHFYKGASLEKWLLFYPVERFMARFTDYLITINEEDYLEANNFPAYGCQVRKIPGIGVDTNKYRDVAYSCGKRQELGIPLDAFLVLAVGELNANKNHQALLRAISWINAEDIYLFIAGKGDEEQNLKQLAADLHIADKVRLLGYCADLTDLYGAADLFVFPSLREGLPVALMEAMASGLPCIASRIRGNADLISDGENGILYSLGNQEELINNILRLKENDEMRRQIGSKARNSIDQFDIRFVMACMEEIYMQALGEGKCQN